MIQWAAFRVAGQARREYTSGVKMDLTYYGNPVLRAKARHVETVDEGLRALASNMLQTMYASDGIGLAAEQVGRTESMCVIDLGAVKPRPGREVEPPSPVPMPLVLVNPEIVKMEGEQVGPEGCLSFPDVYATVRRAETVRVVYTDLENRRQEVDASGLLARALQHEIDHLNGVLLVDRMSMAQKVAVAGKLKRIKQQGAEQAGA